MVSSNSSIVCQKDVRRSHQSPSTHTAPSLSTYFIPHRIYCRHYNNINNNYYYCVHAQYAHSFDSNDLLHRHFTLLYSYYKDVPCI